MDSELSPNRLQVFLKNKWLVGGVAGGILLILVVFLALNSNKAVPVSQTQPNITPNNSTQGTELNSSPTPTKSPELLKAIADQMQVDDEYSNWQEKVHEEYPWTRRLPLTSEKYYLYFDLEKKVFWGKIYATPADNENQIKTEIMQIMKEEDIPTDTYPFEWTVVSL